MAGVGTMAGITLLMGLVGFPIVALGAVFASPGALRDDLARGRSAWRVAAGPLLAFAGLAAVLVVDKQSLVPALPLVVAAIAFLWGRTRSAADADTRAGAAAHPGSDFVGAAPRRAVGVGAVADAG